MGFNSMFSSLAGEGENSDRIMTKNGVRVKWMSGKQPITFAILPAFNPDNADPKTSYYPSILPSAEKGTPDTLAEWGNYAYVYRGIGHGDWKERCDVVSLLSVGEEVCPLDLLYKTIKQSPEWQYLTDDGKFGDPNRQRATLPGRRMLMFCNVLVKGEEQKGAQIGIFSKSIANKLVGENGLIWAPNPSASDADIEANYLAAYANGDITSPQNAPLFVVEKGHDKGEMSAYELKFAQDASRRVMHTQFTQDILATRYQITDLREYLNVLSADAIVALLIRELSGRSPAGYHEYALLREALGSRWQIPEPPAAPAATSTVQGADVPPVQTPVVTPADTGSTPAPAADPVLQTTTAAPASVPPVTVTAQVPVQAPVPEAQVATEANSALKAAQAAGVAATPAATPVAAAPKVVGDAVPKFDKAAFLAKIAAKGGQQ